MDNLVSINVPKITKPEKPPRVVVKKDLTNPSVASKEAQRIKRDLRKLDSLKKAKLEQAEMQILRRLPAIVKRLVDDAEKGDKQAAKMLLDRVLPTQRAVDPTEAATAKGFSVNIQINGQGYVPTLDRVEDSDNEVLDGEFTESVSD